MDSLVSIKSECEDDFAVEFEILPPVDIAHITDERRNKIREELGNADNQLEIIQKRVDELNKEIDRLTNHADGLDYMVAVASGVIAGIVDILYVGEFSLEKANEWGNEKTNEFIVKIAQSQGYEGEDLSGAVRYLENKFPIAADKATNELGGGLQHHLRDFSHHPTPVGLFFSLLTQFTCKVYGADVTGAFHIENVKEKDYILIGSNLPEKFTFGVVNWFFHMVSDMAGSSGSISKEKTGTGLPGPIVSLLKEVSVLPIFKSMNKDGYKEFSVWISKLFNGTLLGKRDADGKLIPLKFDLRTEIGIVHELGKQAIPVIINECIVRGFYFIRRFFMELKEKKIQSVKELGNINWKNTLPFNNRTIVRMLTISTGTFMAIDLADAAIRAEKTNVFAFIGSMVLRVNFVGVGRFAIAVGTDVKMGVKRSKLRNERIDLHNTQIAWLNVKVFYKQADMWIAAEDTGKTIEEAYELIEKSQILYCEMLYEIGQDLKQIGEYIPSIEQKNPGLLDEINDILL